VIVYMGPNVGAYCPLLAIRADGTPVPMPDIRVERDGERVRFAPDGALIYMLGEGVGRADFWRLDLRTGVRRQLTKFRDVTPMRTFDVTPDGAAIVFDRLRDNSDVVLIEMR
jgi:hypothetical protein